MHHVLENNINITSRNTNSYISREELNYPMGLMLMVKIIKFILLQELLAIMNEL